MAESDAAQGSKITMAESDAAQGSKKPLSEYMRKIKEIAGQITKDAHTSSLRCPKSREPRKMRQEVDGLKNNETRNLIIRETADETQELRQQVESLMSSSKETATEIKVLRKQVEFLSRSFENQQSDRKESEARIRELEATSESSAAQINDMKQMNEVFMTRVQEEISRSNRGIRADMAKMKQDSDQKQNTVINILEAMQENQQKQLLQTQRYASTSTLDTVDTGFDEQPTITEEEESEEEEEVANKVDQVKKRINELALQLETSILYPVKSLARHLGLDQRLINEICDKQVHGKDYRNLLFDFIEAWFQHCRGNREMITMEAFLKALKHAGLTIEAKGHKIMKSMPREDQVIIEKTFPYLAENLMVPVTVVHLRGCGLLTPDFHNYIMEMNSQTERVTRLVEVLPILGDNALPDFMDALQKSGQSHIAESIKMSNPERFNPEFMPETRPKLVAEVVAEAVAKVVARGKQDGELIWNDSIKETSV